MRFSHKLTFFIVFLLCLTLSMGGAWSIQQNFSHSLDTAMRQSAALQLRERYALETAFSREKDASSNALFNAAGQHAEQERATSGESSVPFSILSEEGTVLYSNMPGMISYANQWAAVEAGGNKARIFRMGEQFFLMPATPLRGLERPMWLVNAYEVTAQFAERDRQIRQHLVLECAALVLAGVAAMGISSFLTRPLRRLETASRALSEGSADARVQISTGDELEQLGTTFNAMADAVETQMEALREETGRQKRFVAAFTHELKTPMTAILGYANLLRSGEQPAKKRQKAANYIYHEAARLETLSHELLLLLELERGGISLAPVPLTAVLGDVRRSLPERLAQLDVQCEENAVVLADRSLLVDLLRNLVENAAAAEPKDGKVTLRCLRCAQGWTLSVEDKGCGIPQEEMDKITEPFYRVDKSRARANGGNGLGLNLCVQIARAHGSELYIESEAGQGTKVWLTLKEAGK